MLGELANVPTGILLDMVTIILAVERVLTVESSIHRTSEQYITTSTPLAGVILHPSLRRAA